MAIKTFTKNIYGESTYSCRLCKRRTRDTGSNGGVQLCPECYEAAVLENSLNDGRYHSEEERESLESQIDRLSQLAVDKGGNLTGYTKTPGKA